jgi:hypothetical protein
MTPAVPPKPRHPWKGGTGAHPIVRRDLDLPENDAHIAVDHAVARGEREPVNGGYWLVRAPGAE